MGGEEKYFRCHLCVRFRGKDWRVLFYPGSVTVGIYCGLIFAGLLACFCSARLATYTFLFGHFFLLARRSLLVLTKVEFSLDNTFLVFHMTPPLSVVSSTYKRCTAQNSMFTSRGAHSAHTHATYIHQSLLSSIALNPHFNSLRQTLPYLPPHRPPDGTPKICVPLAAPADLLEDLGISPVRGLLLYGPPGCGKTLLARRLSAVLTRRPPAVVSGPEILERFVGSSEANIRALFDYPPDVPGGDEAEQDSALHVIVMDEFDSIGQRRGGGADDGGDRVRDSVVNQ